MKRVIIKRISMLNFKGQRDLQVSFDPVVTSILGANGTGKSTIFDAFTWVLFGKDSHDRSDFEIKTLDASGRPIPKIPHEVSITLEVDGQTITLTRRYNETWRKKRGCAEEEFAGHTQERLYNDVPCSVSEWKDKIAEICTEEDFKYISNPAYFASQRADKQRKKLCEMAGVISDAELAKGNADFLALIERLQGKTIDELKREISAKKRRLKCEIDAIPERIDERKRDMPEDTDFKAIEDELADKETALAKVEAILKDASLKSNAKTQQMCEVANEISNLETKRTGIEVNIQSRANATYNDAVRKNNDIKREIFGLTEQIKYDEMHLADAEATKKRCDSNRAELLAEWRELNARTITFDQSQFECPTCGQPYPAEKAAELQAQMLANFNAEKARLINENVKKGKAVKVQKDAAETAINLRTKKIEDAKADIAKLTSSLTEAPAPTTPEELKAMYEADAAWCEIAENIAKAKGKLKALQDSKVDADDSQHEEAKAVLKSNIDDLKKMLVKKEAMERNQKRIAELEADLLENPRAVDPRNQSAIDPRKFC